MVKTSLEKSHSKFSNFKLTVLALLELFSFQGFFLILAIKSRMSTPMFIGSLILSVGLFALSFVLMRKFKR